MHVERGKVRLRLGQDSSLTQDPPSPSLERMEVDFTPELQAKLTRLAEEQGRDTRAVVREAVERFVDHDEWFLREVATGMTEADRGEFVEHEAVRKLIDRRYPE